MIKGVKYLQNILIANYYIILFPKRPLPSNATLNIYYELT